MEITQLNSEGEFDEILKNDKVCLKIFYFCIENSPECDQMTDILSELKNNEDYEGVISYKIDAVKFDQIAKKLKVINVPAFLFYTKTEVDRLVGADVPAFIKLLSTLVTKVKQENDGNEEQDLNTRLKKLTNKAPCMLFMKGSPDVPRCGFSKQVIALLKSHSAKFETFDILEDFEVREGLKKFSNWPTYPQLYVKGELIGGLDILKELSESGELDEVLKEAGSV